MNSLSIYAKNPKIILAFFLIICNPAFLIVAIRIVSAMHYQNSDFFSFWLAGRMSWSNEHPYMSDQWILGHKEFGADWISDPKFLYPLPLALFFAPLGLLPLATAYTAWIYLSQILVSISILLLIWGKIKNWVHLVFPIAAGAFLFRPTLVTLRNGQLGAFILFIISLTIYLWDHQKWWQGGILLSLITLKPTIGLPILGLLGFWLIVQGRFVAIAASVVAEFILLAIGWARDPQWISEFLLIGNEKFTQTFGHSPTLYGVGGAICNYGVSCSLIVGMIFSVSLIIITNLMCLRKQINTSFEAVSFAIPVALVVTPYIWAYDQILLIVPVALICISIVKLNLPYWLAAVFPIMLTFLSLGLLYLATNRGHDIWTVATPLACFSFLIYLYVNKLSLLKMQTEHDLAKG
jgi:hypothetical protein